MELEYINEKIGRKIRDLRNRNGLTQQELADRAELTKGYISQLERGQVAPSVVTLLDLIECLGTTPSEFFRETEQEHIVYSEDAFSEKIDESSTLWPLFPPLCYLPTGRPSAPLSRPRIRSVFVYCLFRCYSP